MRRNTTILVGVLMWASASVVSADEIVLEQLYGSGVHAFNRGDYRGAHFALSEAIKGGTSDPRAYYFRGLTYLRLGREQDARLDFTKGAELEAGDSLNVYPVSRSLERVQGRARQGLEQYRTTVRAAAVQRQIAQNRAARQALAVEEHRVLRSTPPTDLPPVQGDALSPSRTAQPTLPPEENPFAAQPPAPTPPTAKMPTPPAADDPFGQKPSAEANDDPFGGGAVRTPPQARPKAEAADDPFGGTPVTPTPRNDAGPAAPGDDAAAGSAAPGAIASLVRGIVAGLRGDEDPASIPPQGPPSFELPEAVRGILGNLGIGGPPADPNTATPFSDPGAVPPAGNVMPQPTAPPANTPMTDPFGPSPPAADPFGATPPAADPFAPTPSPTTPPPGGQTPPQPIPPQRAPTTPMPDENDPFK